MIRGWVLAALPMLWALTGCGRGDVLGPDQPGPLLRTDSTSYVLWLVAPDSGLLIPSRRMTIGYTFTNRTGHEVIAEGCGGPDAPLIEKQVGDQWMLAYEQWELLCASPPVRISPGGSYRSQLTVLTFLPGANVGPQWLIEDVAGTYRLNWYAVSPVSLEQRTSNPFTVVPG